MTFSSAITPNRLRWKNISLSFFPTKEGSLADIASPTERLIQALGENVNVPLAFLTSFHGMVAAFNVESAPSAMDSFQTPSAVSPASYST